MYVSDQLSGYKMPTLTSVWQAVSPSACVIGSASGDAHLPFAKLCPSATIIVYVSFTCWLASHKTTTTHHSIPQTNIPQPSHQLGTLNLTVTVSAASPVTYHLRLRGRRVASRWVPHRWQWLGWRSGLGIDGRHVNGIAINTRHIAWHQQCLALQQTSSISYWEIIQTRWPSYHVVTQTRWPSYHVITQTILL